MFQSNKTAYRSKLLILGSGESGCGAACLAQSKNQYVFVSDHGQIASPYREKLIKNKIAFEEYGHRKVHGESWDLILKSPGISPQNPILHELSQRHIPIIDEVEFTFRYCRGKIIAVTGTNGKTTTSSLIYHLLKSANYQVELCGNIGRSFALALLENPIAQYYVLELSSFQLEYTLAFKPDIAVLLNITSDHLDYHRDFETYKQAKFKIAANMKVDDYFFYNSEDLNIREHIPRIKATCKALSFNYENSLLQVQWAGDIYHFDNLVLQGQHNALNMTAAINIALHLNLPKPDIQAALLTFKQLPHRMELVRIYRDIRFIDDSKATNIEATYHALQTYTNIIWIVGGLDKGNDYNRVKHLILSRVNIIICLGKDNRELLKKLSFFKGELKDTNSIKDAVDEAYKLAKAGHIILLSPACSSFDLFKNYRERGLLFQKYVLALPNA